MEELIILLFLYTKMLRFLLILDQISEIHHLQSIINIEGLVCLLDLVDLVFMFFFPLQMSEKAEEAVCEQSIADMLYLTENEGKLRLDSFVI